MAHVIGLDIGGSKIRAGAVSAGGVIGSLAESSTPTKADQVVDACAALIDSVRESHPVVAIGIGAPGTIDPIKGIIVASDSKPMFAGLQIGPELGARFGLPYAVTNDVNAAAVGELVYGIASGFSRILVVSVGTGVGGALLINGRIEEGMHGTTGEIAHLLVGAHGVEPCGCGRSDHLEAIASGPAMEASYAAATQVRIGLPEIVERANAGEVEARDVLAEGARWLGRTVAGFASAVDIDAMVLTGGVAQIGASYVAQVSAAFTDEVMLPLRGVPVLVGSLGNAAPVIGAATYVRARLGLDDT